MNRFFLSTSLFLLFIANATAQIDYVETAFQDYPKDYVHPSAESIINKLKNKVRAFPDRLDYRFEYLNELAIREHWNRFTMEVINLVEYSYKSAHDWSWTPGHNVIGEDARSFLLNTIEDYVFMLYVTGEPAQFDHLRSICEVVLKYSPEHINFLTYPAMTYDAMEAYEAGIIYLQRAEILHPDNGMISLLIAENYENRGMFNAALAYYKRAERFGDQNDAQEAAIHIDRLGLK